MLSKSQNKLQKTEGFAARALPAPPQPTPEMVASHNVSQLPFRRCCSHCTRGRGRPFYHKKVSHEADDPSRPVVSLDYGFFWSARRNSHRFGWRKQNVSTGGAWSFHKGYFCPPGTESSKGTEHFYPGAASLRDVKCRGYSRLVLKSDQEPSMMHLQMQ